jgi:hypothetical protein
MPNGRHTDGPNRHADGARHPRLALPVAATTWMARPKPAITIGVRRESATRCACAPRADLASIVGTKVQGGPVAQTTASGSPMAAAIASHKPSRGRLMISMTRRDQPADEAEQAAGAAGLVRIGGDGWGGVGGRLHCEQDTETCFRQSKKQEDNARVMKASELKGYEYLKLIDLPKPEVSDGKVLMRSGRVGRHDRVAKFLPFGSREGRWLGQ